ncbi:uncharacterized protein BJ171DRAFT_598693, partial [Polychytrium aggregatum]|uniref:uncharacterized protein n=1 Tax=Polychytrium aggregatum TaxID=110093 RepID=UPI0022FE5834
MASQPERTGSPMLDSSKPAVAPATNTHSSSRSITYPERPVWTEVTMDSPVVDIDSPVPVPDSIDEPLKTSPPTTHSPNYRWSSILNVRPTPGDLRQLAICLSAFLVAAVTYALLLVPWIYVRSLIPECVNQLDGFVCSIPQKLLYISQFTLLSACIWTSNTTTLRRPKSQYTWHIPVVFGVASLSTCLSPIVFDSLWSITQLALSLVIYSIFLVVGLTIVPRKVPLKTFLIWIQPLMAGYFVCFIVLVGIFGVACWRLMAWSESIAANPVAIDIEYSLAPVALGGCGILALWVLEKSLLLVDRHFAALEKNPLPVNTKGFATLRVIHTKNLSRPSGCRSALSRRGPVLLESRMATGREVWTSVQRVHLTAFVTSAFAGVQTILTLSSMYSSPRTYVLNLTFTVLLN